MPQWSGSVQTVAAFRLFEERRVAFNKTRWKYCLRVNKEEMWVNRRVEEGRAGTFPPCLYLPPLFLLSGGVKVKWADNGGALLSSVVSTPFIGENPGYIRFRASFGGCFYSC